MVRERVEKIKSVVQTGKALDEKRTKGQGKYSLSSASTDPNRAG